MVEVKPEIKIEEAKALGDIDEFEEDTDLQIPPQDGQAWLIKVSEDMWKAWSEAYKDSPDDTNIEIGKFRVFKQPATGDAPQKIQVKLNSSIPQHKKLPTTYDIDVKASSYNNTVVFSEKDLPGHPTRAFGTGPSRAGARPTGVNKHDRYALQQPRKPGTYRSAIPKQTSLAPKIANEAVAKPVEDATELEHFVDIYKNAFEATRKTKFIGNHRVRHPGQDIDSFAFTSTSKPGKGKKKVPKEKAVRMEKDKLLDALMRCYSQYSYWPLRSLRQELHQPEAYIRETLEEIAHLQKAGDFAQTYKLKPEYESMVKQQTKEETVAPVKMEETDEGTGDEMEDDDEEDFEDVKMD